MKKSKKTRKSQWTLVKHPATRIHGDIRMTQLAFPFGDEETAVLRKETDRE